MAQAIPAMAQQNQLQLMAGIALVLASLLPARPASAQPPFEQWLAEFATEAILQGISEPVVRSALKGVTPVQKILGKDRNQPEFVLSLDSYMSRFLTPENIGAGRAMLQKHATLLNAVSKKYNVQPRFIVAIWGIETRYGAIKPGTPVIPALATLAWDRRRPEFFRNELLAALRILDAGDIALPRLQGSWAGAMGQPQFLPSSYIKYAQDWDGDGKRDIWDNQGDVFASIANYFTQQGWSAQQTWGRPVRLPGGKLALRKRPGNSGCRAIDQLTAARPLAQWQAMGVRRIDGEDLPRRGVPASLALPEGENGPAFIVYGNYEVLLRYNCAHFYALTAGRLADNITGG